MRLRLGVLAGALLVALVLAHGAMTTGGLPHAWEQLRVPATSPAFADTRSITHSIDCLAIGKDPYTTGSCDPWQRRYSYPPIWLGLRFVGVTSKTSMAMGWVLAGMSLASLLILFRARTVLGGVVGLLSVLSFPVLLAMERGNSDEVIFFLLVCGLFGIERVRGGANDWLIGGLIVGLTILKIFPVAGAIVLARNRRGWWLAAGTMLTAIAALLASSGGRLALILANTPQALIGSYGSYPLVATLGQHMPVAARIALRDRHGLATLVATLVGLAAIAAGVWWRTDLKRWLPMLNFRRARGQAAGVGLAVFGFTFVRGSSFDYRLIFLLGAVAYLVEDLERDEPARGWLRSGPLLAVLLLFFAVPFERPLLHEALDGLVYVLACVWLAGSLASALSGGAEGDDLGSATLLRRI